MSASTQCPHTTFQATVEVARLEDNTLKYAEVRIICIDCGKPAVFRGLDVGVNPDRPTCAFGDDEARLPFIVQGDPAPKDSASFSVRITG